MHRTFPWSPKQYLGDDDVLAMEWDARGMHHWLLNISWQQEPPGSLPNDMSQIRRWLGSPSDDVWRRVRPQIFAAWTLQGDRWFNKGMIKTAQRQRKCRANARAKPEQVAQDAHISKEEVFSFDCKEVKLRTPSDLELATAPTKERFKLPSLGEVRAYCEERHNSVDPQQWFDYYTSNGWRVGRNPMKDWRAAIRTWERNGRNGHHGSSTEAIVDRLLNESD